MTDSLMEKTYKIAEQKQITLANTFGQLMPKLGKVLRDNY